MTRCNCCGRLDVLYPRHNLFICPTCFAGQLNDDDRAAEDEG